MNDFFILEKKCQKLKRKKFIRNSIIIFILFAILTTLIYLLILLNTKEENKTIVPPLQSPKKEIKNNIVDVNKTEKIIPKVVIIHKQKDKKIKIQTPKQQIEPVLNLDIDFENIKNIDKPSKKIEKEVKKEIQTPKQVQKIETKKTGLIIKQKNPINIDNALEMASTYYDVGLYNESIKWCKIASKIDNYDERIWKLYALNLEKMGKKDKAIKILKVYLKYKDSKNIKALLKRISQ